MRNICAAFFLTLSIPVFAQVVGQMPPHGDTAVSFDPPYTFIDATRPAITAGTLTTATIRWRGAACSAAFRIKVLQPQFDNTFFVVASRGPFDAPATGVRGGLVTVPLTPPVTVSNGAVIAVTILQPITCGSVLLTPASQENSVLEVTGTDVQSGNFSSASHLANGYVLNAIAAPTTSTVVGVVPAVGATAGGNGSFFRTAIQLLNPDATPMTGKLVYHPAGKAAAASDPSIPYSIGFGSVTSFSDIVTQMGQSGLGSLDIVATNGVTPQVTTRVFNDTPGGTSGFYEETVDPNAYSGNQPGYFVAPSNTTNFRMNIGVRTFAAGATIDVSAPGTAGVLHKTYPPNYFEQKTALDFLGVSSLNPDEVITVTVSSGSAQVYSTITDNRTNDSAIHYLH